jgi:ATP-dependent RNA helicase RhlE
VRTGVIHGNKSQGARSRVLEDFKAGRVRVLVATDIAARGLDIAHLPLVVNFDLPLVAEDYVHRIGRTGRAGQHGRAASLMSPSETGLLRQIQRLVVAPLERVAVPGIVETTTHRVDESAPAHVKKVDSVATRRRQHGRRGRYAGARGHRTDGRRPISVARLSGV